MSERKSRQFSSELKPEAVRQVTEGGKPLVQVARELGIRPDMLRGWRRQAEGRAGGQPVPFTTFFKAEIKVEKEFNPALVIDETNKAVTVEVDPSAWFLSAGKVIDLSAFDFVKTGKVVEFEAKMANGFTRIEFDD